MVWQSMRNLNWTIFLMGNYTSIIHLMLFGMLFLVVILGPSVSFCLASQRWQLAFAAGLHQFYAGLQPIRWSLTSWISHRMSLISTLWLITSNHVLQCWDGSHRISTSELFRTSIRRWVINSRKTNAVLLDSMIVRLPLF